MQAISTRKVHYLKQIEEQMDASAAPGAQPLEFTRLYPNLQFLDGPIQVLDEVGKRWYMENLQVDHGMKRYINHMLNNHDGEARIVGDTWWSELPAPGGGLPTHTDGWSVLHPNLWHYQHMKNPATRAWLLERKNGPYKHEELSPGNALWILAVEGNETSFVKYAPAPGGSNRLEDGTFWIKGGFLVTLAEMLRFGMHACTCYDIYRTYVDLPVLYYRRAHSTSHSERGLQRRWAKRLHYEETGPVPGLWAPGPGPAPGPRARPRAPGPGIP